MCEEIMKLSEEINKAKALLKKEGYQVYNCGSIDLMGAFNNHVQQIRELLTDKRRLQEQLAAYQAKYPEPESEDEESEEEESEEEESEEEEEEKICDGYEGCKNTLKTERECRALMCEECIEAWKIKDAASRIELQKAKIADELAKKYKLQ